MIDTFLIIGVISAIVAAFVSAIAAPRLARLGRALQIMTAAAIVPLGIIVLVAAEVVAAKAQGGQGDMSDLAGAALILIGTLAAGVGFVAGLLAAYAVVRGRRAS